MTELFQPIGEKAQWEMVHDALDGRDVGDVITYAEIAEALDVPVSKFKANRGPFYKAATVWGTENHRALAPVAGIGYRVVDAHEHEILARRHHRKSKRSLVRGRRLLENADRTRLDAETRQRFDVMERSIARHEDMIRRIETDQEKMQRALSESKVRHEGTEKRIAALEEALRRHNIEPSG